jgi:hypothetical protein
MTSATAKSKETTVNAKGNQNNDHERKPSQFAVVSIQSTSMTEETSWHFDIDAERKSFRWLVRLSFG